VIIIFLVWVLLANGEPVDWTAAVAVALVGPTIGIAPLAGRMRQRADEPGKRLFDLGSGPALLLFPADQVGVHDPPVPLP
jgi:hypothetical protein